MKKLIFTLIVISNISNAFAESCKAEYLEMFNDIERIESAHRYHNQMTNKINVRIIDESEVHDRASIAGEVYPLGNLGIVERQLPYVTFPYKSVETEANNLKVENTAKMTNLYNCLMKVSKECAASSHELKGLIHTFIDSGKGLLNLYTPVVKAFENYGKELDQTIQNRKPAPRAIYVVQLSNAYAKQFEARENEIHYYKSEIYFGGVYETVRKCAHQ